MRFLATSSQRTSSTDTARPLDWSEDIDLRWLMLRMITEYAQHGGHLDLLREGVDGRTGA